MCGRRFSSSTLSWFSSSPPYVPCAHQGGIASTLTHTQEDVNTYYGVIYGVDLFGQEVDLARRSLAYSSS